MELKKRKNQEKSKKRKFSDKKKNSSKESKNTKNVKLNKKFKISMEEKKKISDALLEELLEDDNFKDAKIKHFLTNPLKTVSLEKINSSPPLSLEQTLPKTGMETKEEKENVEYSLFKNPKEEKYRTILISEEFKEKDLGEKQKILREQKRFYERMKSLSSELKEEKHSGIKYIKPEDTIEEDYLIKKKFFNNST